MRRSRGSIWVVLPTDIILQEFEPASNLLEMADVPPKMVVEHLISQWAQLESEAWRYQDLRHVSPFDMMIGYLLADLALDDSDIVNRPQSMSMSDRHDLKTVILALCRKIYQQIVPILEEFELQDYQIQTLGVGRWAGRSMIVEITR